MKTPHRTGLWRACVVLLCIAAAPSAFAEVIVVDLRSGDLSEANLQRARASSQDANAALGDPLASSPLAGNTRAWSWNKRTRCDAGAWA